MRPMIIVAAALFLSTAAADAKTVTVKMLNKDPETKERMVYAPHVIRVAMGDTVTWEATSKGHNVEFIRGAIPEGVARFKSKINKTVSYKFSVPGVYAYKCTPHYGMGMVGMIVVGEDLTNLGTVSKKRYPGRAKKRMKALIERLG